MPISDKRSAWWDERLENWALWKAGGGGISSGVSSAYDGVWGDCAPRPPPPLVGEALDTDHLVCKLPRELGKQGEKMRQALVAWYEWSGTLEERARDMDAHVNTLRNLVDSAKEELERLDGERWNPTYRKRLADAA